MPNLNLTLPSISETDLESAKGRRRIMSQLIQLEEQLRFVLSNIEYENIGAQMRQTLDNMATTEAVEESNGKIESVSTRVEQTEESIQQKADKTTVDELEQTVSQQGTAIEQTAEAITMKADKAELNALGQVVSQQGTVIEQTAEAIELKAEKSELNALGERVTAAETSLTLKADQATLTTTAGNLQSQIDAVPGQITLAVSSKADKDDVDGLTERVGEAETALTLKADQATLTTTANGLQSQIDAVPGQITLAVSGKADENDVNALGQRVTDAETALTLKADQATLTTTAGNLQSQIDAVPGQITLAVSGKLDADGAAVAVDTQNGIVIDQNGVYVEGGEIELNTQGEDGYLHVTADGVSAGRVYAANMARRYAGASWVNVDPGATDAQVATGAYVRSLADGLALVNGRVLDYDVRLAMVAGMNEYGNLQVTGISGMGRLYITCEGGEASIYGQLSVAQCGVRVYVYRVNMVSADDSALLANGCAYLECNNLLIKSAATHAFMAKEGACFQLNGVTLVASVSGTYAGYAYNARGDISNTIGTGAFVVHRAHVTASGTVPDGNVAYWECPEPNNLSELIPTGADGSTPPAQTVVTATFTANHTDSYGNGWGFGQHNDVAQGWNTSGGRIRGCMWFDISAISAAVSGRTVKQASLRLSMWTGVGRGTAVTVELSGTSKEYDGRSGSPAQTASYGAIGTTTPGETAEITIPTAAIADLASGAIKALMLYSSDTAGYNGRGYSKNFAGFDGETSGTAETLPRLTVTYQ